MHPTRLQQRNGWKPMDGYPVTETLVLRGLGGAPVLPAGAGFAPARYLVHEWRDYAVEWTGSRPERAAVELQGLPAEAWRRVGGAAVFRFENQLGLARLHIQAAGTAVPLTLEVLSPKYPTAEAHRTFYDALVTDLSARAAALPFAVVAPTALRARESRRRRSDLFVWHFLRQHSDGLLRALRAVLREPRRVLAAEDRIRPLSDAASVGPETLVGLVARPADLMPVPPAGAAATWPLARALERPRDGRRFLPTRLVVTEAEETLDTPEHRFIRAFLEEFVGAAERAQARLALPPSARAAVRAVTGEVREALETTFLGEVGPLTAVPWTSRVLQRAHGYRELLQAWRIFQAAADPFPVLDQALAARDVATLYEWWCWYALADHLAATLGFEEREFTAPVDDRTGLPLGLRLRFRGGWTLTYNRSFPHGAGPWRSYALALRPDFILAQDEIPVLALDAKFRFEHTAWELGVAAPAEDEATAPRTPERLALAADLYKMHTYRDALGLRACLVVYPGRDTEVAPFYATDGSVHRGWSLARLLADSALAGVGALPLSPEDPSGRLAPAP